MNKRERQREKKEKNVNHPGVTPILRNTPAPGVMNPRRHPHNDKNNLMGQKCNLHFPAKMPLRKIFRLSEEAVKENFQSADYFFQQNFKNKKYSLTSTYGHLYNMNSSP